MTSDWRIAIAQINCTVGDLAGNGRKILERIEEARRLGADVITFPELSITGYPPEDLLLKPKFIADNLTILREMASSVPDLVVVVGFVNRRDTKIYNSAAVICKGEIKGVYDKTLLPNYGVFDEKRYFAQGESPLVFRYGAMLFGVNICEDIWFKEGPTCAQAGYGARIIFNVNASPYHTGKIRVREEIVRARAIESGAFIVYTNLVGGQDELIFDGQSFVMDNTGVVIAKALAFKEDLLLVDIPRNALSGCPVKATTGCDRGESSPIPPVIVSEEVPPKQKEPLKSRSMEALDPVGEVYEALCLGLHDYVTKNGFRGVTVGLSGGIDSALVAALAVDALGAGNVVAVFMPSRFTSGISFEDARELADKLAIKLLEVPIDGIYDAYLSTLKPFFTGLKENVTEENIQARIRGNILMAFSNKFGWLVLTTGNKSEMSVGYATLYGDMAGGFALIKDVPKTLVYGLSRYRNTISTVIPERILTRAPSAELKPDQKDSDTLLPYDDLDPILKAYIEEDKAAEEIFMPGLEREAVFRTVGMVDLSEYKRRQSPPGIKITPKAFGKDRRMPITNKYRGEGCLLKG
jgi:NAD+ synthase (glutamine-hydrolysing)